MTKILICICTYHRNKELIECLSSLNKAILPKNLRIKLLILDNSKNKTTFNLFKEYKKKLNFPIIYSSEKKRGIVFARNKCLKIGKKMKINYLGFLDDDCKIKKNWFINLKKLIIKFKPSIITGPQIHKNELANIFEKSYNENIAFVKWSSNNNVFIKREILIKENLCFDKRLNKFGMGEDQLFFLKLYYKGYKILWSNKLIVTEITHKHRKSLKWIIRRSFRLGVLGSYIDKQINGNINGIIINYLKSFFYLLKSSFEIIKFFKKKFYLYSISYFFRSLGRILGIMIYKKINFYKI
jgi:succinoglycan biosynthesis protein ExoM